MNKNKTIIASILIIVSGITIMMLSDSYTEGKLIGFFGGLVFGFGIVLFFKGIINNKKVVD